MDKELHELLIHSIRPSEDKKINRPEIKWVSREILDRVIWLLWNDKLEVKNVSDVLNILEAEIWYATSPKEVNADWIFNLVVSFVSIRWEKVRNLFVQKIIERLPNTPYLYIALLTDIKAFRDFLDLYNDPRVLEAFKLVSKKI